MNKNFPIVALIGQTNAGKSSLLNRFARKKTAIVAREEGTTRDNVVAKIDDRFLLIDTAGLKDPSDDFEASIQDQIADAVDSADLILVTLDSAKYPNHDDKSIALSALKSGKPVFLVLNKSDLGDSLPLEEFRSLGIKNIYKTSATTGYGTNDLKNAIFKTLNSERSQSDDLEKSPTSLKLALIGRPNVGKSSLFNGLAKKQQALVANLSGTTRDINRVEVKYHSKTIEILDTAGLRKPGKREVGIEKFSALRTLSAIEESDVCALLIDATEPHSKLDQSLAGQIIDAGKGIILVVTKTDLVESTDEIINNLEVDFNFAPFAPVLLTSSVTGKNLTKLFDLAVQIDQSRRTEIKTSDLNRILNDAIMSHPPAGLKNTIPKPKYIVQTDTTPPWFVVHGHSLGLLHWSWKRFLERKVRESYPFVGLPIKFSYISEDRKDKDAASRRPR
jgi:GTP-binding protein